MSGTPRPPGDAAPPESLRRLAHLTYGLHAFSALTGLLGAAFVVTAFLTGWPSLIAVVLTYARRSRARGTYLESHLRWQLRTFWLALLWVCLAALLALTVVGLPLAWAVALGAGVWVLYRIGRGWLRLAEARPAPP
ncbi:MAG: DUF4870 family protein [Deferrisomatales bacterium]